MQFGFVFAHTYSPGFFHGESFAVQRGLDLSSPLEVADGEE